MVELLARMPELAAAFAAATVSADHVDAVATARRRVDPSVRAAFDAFEDHLAVYAKGAHGISSSSI